MQRLERYVTAGGQRLRCGYTTGTCAAAATRAAAELLLAHALVPSVVVATPAGVEVRVDVEESDQGMRWAACAVCKDAGDDPDVTDGVLVWARVMLASDPGVRVEGGAGVGRVTRPGLDQPVGAAAINSTPRAMIAQAAQEVADACGYAGGLVVEISIPAGRELAKRTFNPRLGIEGGLSVLGTTGIVRPMSEEALVESIRLELRMRYEEGLRHVLVVPGNYGRAFAGSELGLPVEQAVTCSNYLGACIDEAALLGYRSMLLVGHLGKLVKVAAGVMNTHSRVADCRLETLAAHAALAGASRQVVVEVMDSATTDAALGTISQAGLLPAVTDTLMARMAEHLAHRAAGKLQVEAVVFSHEQGLLGATAKAGELLELHRQVSPEKGRGSRQPASCEESGTSRQGGAAVPASARDDAAPFYKPEEERA